MKAILCLTQNVAIKFFPLDLTEPSREEGRMNIRARGDGEYKEEKALKSSVIKVHINLQRQKQHAQGLNDSALGPLHIYFGFQLSVLMEFLTVNEWVS